MPEEEKRAEEGEFTATPSKKKKQSRGRNRVGTRN
jgi:hypothetical protein